MTEPEPTEAIQHFDGTVVKLVERTNEETGETETLEVMSDNLYPGEKLKSEADAEAAKAKADQAKAAAETTK